MTALVSVYLDQKRIKMKLAISIIAVLGLLIALVGCTAKPSSEEINSKVPNEKIISCFSDSIHLQTKNRSIDEELNNFLNQNSNLWKVWQEKGVNLNDTFTVDFYFYAAEKENAIRLVNKLESYGLIANVFSETSFIILKGWKIKTQIRRVWDLETLQEYSRVLHFAGKDTGPFLEGNGTTIE